MAKREEEQMWTTWEELLLAYAVKRHGFKDWDSVSMEIQSRTSLPQVLTTPHNCKLKFQDLNRRFATQTQNDFDGNAVPWLDDLRKLRVAELRREVNRYDDSILSLQLKVKRLEEQGDRSSSENMNDHEKPDLENASQPETSENDIRHGGPVEKLSSGRVPGKSITGEDSDRENQSVNGSNSTGIKAEAGPRVEVQESQHLKSGSGKPDLVYSGSKRVGEDSCNESSGSIAKGLPVEGKAKRADSVSESKGEGDRTKEGGSDVHSSASLTRKRHHVFQGSVGGGEEASRVIKRVAIKSQPFFDVFELIRSHKHGSLFGRRLQSQETDRYSNTIRQHMDLQGIQTGLEQGYYASSSVKLYRDLLLLFNNAIVFFPKSSVEYVAAQQLRSLVSEKMEEQLKHNLRSEEPTTSPLDSPQAKQPLERTDSLLAKHKSSAPIIVCRKRSSISVRKTEPQIEFKKTNPVHEPIKSSSPDLVPPLSKQNKNDHTGTGTRSMRRSCENNEESNASPGGSSKQTSSTPSKPQKTDDINTSTVMNKKKKRRGAADFLKRIKGNNSPVEKLTSNNKISRRGNAGEQMQKKMRGGGGVVSSSSSDQKRDGNKPERVLTLRQSGGSKKATKDEYDSTNKRTVGRPPKNSSDSLTGNRGRDPEIKKPRKGSRR